MVAKKTSVRRRPTKKVVASVGASAIASVRSLRQHVNSEAGEKAFEVAEAAILFLSKDDTTPPEVIERMHRALTGARPGENGDDAAKIRKIQWVFGWDDGGDEESALKAIQILSQIDEAFASLAVVAVADIRARVHSGQLALTGAIAELMIAARALGTLANAERGTVQRQVASALNT